MNKEELESLNKLPQFDNVSIAWTKAFEIYNNDHSNQRPLTLNCRGCYFKVRTYVIKKFILKFAKA